jgi:hypothetical protein
MDINEEIVAGNLNFILDIHHEDHIKYPSNV